MCGNKSSSCSLHYDKAEERHVSSLAFVSGGKGKRDEERKKGHVRAAQLSIDDRQWMFPRLFSHLVLRRPVSKRYVTSDSVSDNRHEGARGVASDSIYMLMPVADLDFSKGISGTGRDGGRKGAARGKTSSSIIQKGSTERGGRKQEHGQGQDTDEGSIKGVRRAPAKDYKGTRQWTRHRSSPARQPHPPTDARLVIGTLTLPPRHH